MKPAEHQALLRMLGILPSEEAPVDPEKPALPDFDAGPREPAPSSDPKEGHNAVVARLLQEDRWRRRGA
ncbi:MAG TPA: hypothetical protein VFY54_17480 [Rubrobacter sp.]|nr:hypothetical protein [Rubrobacter sp.]